MWLQSLFLLFAIFIVGILFIAGSVLLIIGFLKKRRSLSKIGFLLFSFPILLAMLIFACSWWWEKVAAKPTKNEIAGTYQIIKITGLHNSQMLSQNHQLKLYPDGHFTLPKTKFIELCSSGNYDVNYELELNELTFDCQNYSTFAHIDRGFSNYKIEFIIGDPDSGESVYFKKVDEKLAAGNSR